MKDIEKKSENIDYMQFLMPFRWESRAKLYFDQNRNYTQGYFQGESNVSIFLKCLALKPWPNGDAS